MDGLHSGWICPKTRLDTEQKYRKMCLIASHVCGRSLYMYLTPNLQLGRCQRPSQTPSHDKHSTSKGAGIRFVLTALMTILLRSAQPEDLMGMQACNLQNLPENYVMRYCAYMNYI
jgi:hypothetical protein